MSGGTGPGGGDGAAAIEHSPIESERFGFRIFRGKLPEVDGAAIGAALRAQRVDIAMLRFPSARQFELSRLEESGYPYLVADTLVYYDVDLTAREPAGPRNVELSFVACGVEQREALHGVVAEIFDGHVNHYRANPLLDPGAIREAHEDWALRHAAAEDRGRIAWLAYRGSEPVAFCACSFGGDECEGVLYGVRAAAARGGIYGDLIRFTQRAFRERGFRRMLVSTQSHNLAVQKVWTREGFRILSSSVTVHVNSLLDRTLVEPRTLEVAPESPGALVERLTGACGELAGPGWRIVAEAHRFLRPVVPGRSCRLELRLPLRDEARGTCRVTAAAVDDGGECCLVARADLRREA